jgi:hypothetical protein
MTFSRKDPKFIGDTSTRIVVASEYLAKHICRPNPDGGPQKNLHNVSPAICGTAAIFECAAGGRHFPFCSHSPGDVGIENCHRAKGAISRWSLDEECIVKLFWAFSREFKTGRQRVRLLMSCGDPLKMICGIGSCPLNVSN